jgi:lipopolysaccharide/colanic/teichoic acid biosynthesis glycosyltransferase
VLSVVGALCRTKKGQPGRGLDTDKGADPLMGIRWKDDYATFHSPRRWRKDGGFSWGAWTYQGRATARFTPSARIQPKVRAADEHAWDRRLELASKRCFDVIVASALGLLFAPGLLVIAAAIKASSPGPIIFRQERYGLSGRTFEIWKFRTMFVEASDPSGTTQTREGDPRVTPVGRLLRRSSLDELPQLWNVIRGDMSLVGPRPHVPGMLAGGKLYEELVPYYFERHRMRVGITGLAQVNGLRGSTLDPARAKARVDQDLEYIRNWSLTLDLRILWATFRQEFLTGNGD